MHSPLAEPRGRAQVGTGRAISGYFDVGPEHFAAVRLEPEVCPQAQIWGGQVVGCGAADWACSPRAAVRVEAMCAPFVVPLHAIATLAPPPPPPPPLRTNRTRRVLHPVLIGHVSSYDRYKGTEFTNTTGGVADPRDPRRGTLVVDGRRFPLAAEGDIPTCSQVLFPYCCPYPSPYRTLRSPPPPIPTVAPTRVPAVLPKGPAFVGTALSSLIAANARSSQVSLRCEEHFEMTETPGAYANPTCLRSGEWEPAQRCEPIWCPAYRPPVHGAVFPTGRVRAGDRVEVSCFEGYPPPLRTNRTRRVLHPVLIGHVSSYDRYKRVWGSPTAREDPACLDARVFEEGVTCAPPPPSY